MAKINQKQVVGFLNDRKQELQTELNKINTALTALLEPEAPTKRKYTRKARATQPEAKNVKRMVTAKKKAVSTASKSSAASSVSSLDERILVALRQIGSASKSQLIQELAAKHPGESPNKLSRGVALRLAMLAKKGNVQPATKDDQVTYSINS